MQTEIIIAGFGGQGVLFAGQLLAYAGMDEGKQITWIPSYGPEMRGGTANCTVVISDEEIGSPFVHNPQAVIAMNRPSLDKYEPLVKPGGVLVVNSSMNDRKPVRTDIRVVEIAANEEAEKLGDQRMANMILLGALLANLPVLPEEAIKKALKGHLPERHQKLLGKNFDALAEGARYLP
ncbi:MAG: 2-oxoacid:ferredoxin oxidoreductase subunit gamma [Anaerolineaceae bacterium]|jgi:2-oxoglutarate ferredoxin oxidoreductase subunit gamma|nr:2-oxoacid:ferredoxin oxidoreductase subunit gamma [Anaerolineaceae bacterium]